MRLLLVEDHSELARWLLECLNHSGYVVEHLDRGDHADLALATNDYDLVILDLSLPKLDGIEVLKRLRGRGDTTPVLVLTARGTKDDRVLGLNLGANDYLPKPFELDELEARIRALLYRGQTPQTTIGKLTWNTRTREVSLAGRPLVLTRLQLALFEVLAARLGRPVAREAIFDRMYERDADVRIESIEIHVYRLRKKLEGSGVVITAFPGLGYALSVRP